MLLESLLIYYRYWFDWLINWWMDGLINWLIDSLIDSLIYLFIRSFIHSLMCCYRVCLCCVVDAWLPRQSSSTTRHLCHDLGHSQCTLSHHHLLFLLRGSSVGLSDHLRNVPCCLCCLHACCDRHLFEPSLPRRGVEHPNILLQSHSGFYTPNYSV